jgi:hypothetical protein
MGSDVMMVVHMIWRCFAKAQHLTLIAVLMVAGVAAGARADARLDEGLKVSLQNAMLQFIDNAAAPDGGFRYIDRSSGAMKVIYPGAIHPKIIPLDGDYFLCIEMLDPNGTARLVDFLVRICYGLSG